MPYMVRVPAVLFGALALVTAFGAALNLGVDRWNLSGGVFLGSLAVAAAATALCMVRRLRFGSYLGFGLALLLTLARCGRWVLLLPGSGSSPW
ncbi:hypothetical protein [Plantactinospora sp. CA-290183]|uniref:hypothetical protein n=1 Tax=Plantactinospora sp. CA-290183 TaxID=3240006 RepID=UPI003D8E4122